MFTGLAIIHGLVAQYRLGSFWLTGFYVALVLVTQLIYPFLMVLAIVDSVFDFRGLKNQKNDSDAANGER